MNDVNAALHHWQRVRELVRQHGTDAASTTLLALACSQALSFAWRVGASAITGAEIFEEGSAAAERTGNPALLASLNAAYGAVRGVNQGAVLDYVRYTAEAVRIADGIGDVELRAGMRTYLLFSHMYCGHLNDTERVADEISTLVVENLHLGSAVIGMSPLLAARAIRLLALGRRRDPATALNEIPLARKAAMDAGYPELALWALSGETELKNILGDSNDISVLAQTAIHLTKNLGAIHEILAATVQCDSLACANDWGALSVLGADTLGRVRERGTGRLLEPRLLSHIGTAQGELGNLETSRAAAQEGVEIMRELQGVWSPHCYAVLARAQLALAEPVADIASTLDEYEALLTRTGFHIYEGELHELRAQLFEREGQTTEHLAAMARAHDCYTRFGMTAQAARIAVATSCATG